MSELGESYKSDSTYKENSSSKISMEDLEEAINNLQPELLEALKNEHIVINSVNVVKNPINRQIYDSKKKQLVKPLKTQLNFRVPESLKTKNDKSSKSIKNDLLFYKKAYETEAANINKIIEQTNILNTQLLEPLQSIKEALKEYNKNCKMNIENLNIPYNNRKEGIDSIEKNNKNEEEKKELEKGAYQIDEQMNSYKEQSIIFFKETSIVNEQLTEEITTFINSFKELKISVEELKRVIVEGFGAFENSSPEFEDLDDTERIKKVMLSITNPLVKVTKLISENKEKLEKAKKSEEEKNEKDSSIANKMMTICEELKNRAKTIAEKINETRMKINLSKLDLPHLDIQDLNVKEMKESINDIKDKIEETSEKNIKIQEEVKKRTEDFINESRLDILFIIDLTHSINTYLGEIKSNFINMINKINKNCPTASIYSGFVGYRDFSELYLDQVYIDIDFEEDYQKINEKIKYLDSEGGGDTCEDLAGAFDLALKKDWKGKSRFAILATDAPCHGTEYHSPDVEDNFPDGDPEKRDIKEKVKEFASKNISLFCAKFNDITDMMYNIFKKEYEESKSKETNSEFTVENCKDLCETIIKKASKIYQNKKTEGKEK